MFDSDSSFENPSCDIFPIFFHDFFLEVCVIATISRSFHLILILIRGSKIRFWIFFESVFRFFYDLLVSVRATISISFDCFSILIRVAKTRQSLFCVTFCFFVNLGDRLAQF